MALQVPDRGWRIGIVGVYHTEARILVVSELSRGLGAAIQVISTVRDSVEVQAPPLPVQHLVPGKKWGWENKEPYVFLKNKEQLAEHLAGAKRIYQRKPPGKELS